VWVADWQRAGRGRRGRVWCAPPGTSLLFSVLVRDCRLPPFAQLAASSLALCATLEPLGLAPRIKWPNDVLLRDRKVAGVLAERVAGAAPPYTILGIGLNVVYGAARDALPPTATALDWELAAAGAAAPPTRGWLLARLLGHLATLLAQPALAWETALYPAWLARLWRHHQRVRLALDTTTLEGQAEGATPDGALLLRTADGHLRRITTGDVLL
jgi:BirA family biotin operon repressor/biotin-[acetyl-CoA-carboxylase] ligase